MASHLNASQLKRLDLARALASGPKLLLLDEFAAGLTPSELVDIAKLLRRIRATPSHRTLPVVVLSTRAMSARRKEIQFPVSERNTTLPASHTASRGL